MEGNRTREIEARRISLCRLEGEGTREQDSLLGWEYSPPTPGERYLVYLGKGRLLRTSPVKSVSESQGAIMIHTLHSVYRVKYLD